MASATSTTKRRTSVGAKKKAAKRGTLGASAASSTGVVAASKKQSHGMQNSTSSSIQLAPQNASVSEKRRIAALISWERRRAKTSSAKNASKPKPTATEASKSRRKSPASKPAVARSVTPPKDKKRVSIPSAKRRKIEDAAASKRKVEGHDRSQSAKKGSEKKKSKEAVSEIRRKAAKLGWERRQKKQLAESDSVAAEEASPSTSHERSSSSVVDKKKAAPASSRAVGGYSVAARRKAAMLGWAKRRNEKTASRRESSSSSSDAAPSRKQPGAATRSRVGGNKRSRRSDPEASAEAGGGGDGRRMNELTAYLRLSRGWMEFHPSSRHGSGTATYGYIPSSIATFIRSGAISQRTVLDRGTLGVHYALDWDGYGGLKEMIDRFGEDFSPYPTEDMMECAHVPEWELGDDLPWRDTEKAEDEKLRKREGEKLAAIERTQGFDSDAEYDEEMQDILFVAKILASLDCNAAANASGLKQCNQGGSSSDAAAEEGDPSITGSSSILPISHYNNSDGYNSAAKECPLSHLADVTVEKECKDQCEPNFVEENVLIIQSPRQDFKHWNFGLC